MTCKSRMLMVQAMTIVALSGCSLGDWHSIHREFKTTQLESQLIDVKQRSIMVSPGVPTIESTLVKSDDGTVVAEERFVPARPFVCAEPSPDALTVLSSAMMASAEHQSGTKGSFNFNSSEAGIAFGLRTQSIQLLRDAYYRACEARMSGSIDDETYDVLIRRLNNQTVAYLAIEQITSGAAGSAKSSVQAPDFAALTAAVEKSRADAVDKQKKKSDLEDQIKNEKDATKLEALKVELKKAETEFANANTAKLSAEEALIKGGKTQVTVNEDAKKALPVSDAAVSAAKSIALSIVEGDNSPQMCFAYRRRHRDRVVQNDPISAYCKSVLDNHLDLQKAAIARRKAVTDMINAHCTGAFATDNDRLFCAQLVNAPQTSSSQPQAVPMAEVDGKLNFDGRMPSDFDERNSFE